MSESFPLPTEPEGVIPSLLERFNSGKVEAMMALYAPEAVFVTNDGRTLTDRTEIAAQFYAKNPQNPKHQKISDGVLASTHHPGMKKGSGCTIPGHQVTRGSASAGLPRARLNVAEMMGKFRLLVLTW